MIHMPPQLTVNEARAIDAAAVDALDISSMLLMENAARGVCQSIQQNFDGSTPIFIASGFGNNGGDGLALTRLLAAEGINARIYLIDAGRPLTDDAQANRLLLERCRIPIISDPDGEQLQTDVRELSRKSLIVDCLLGTGIQGNLRTPYAETVNALNESDAQVLAVDIPSGLDAQTGKPGNPTVVANRTVTFVGMKTGFHTADAKDYTGDIDVAPIGLPLNWTIEFLKQLRREDSEANHNQELG